MKNRLPGLLDEVPRFLICITAIVNSKQEGIMEPR